MAQSKFAATVISRNLVRYCEMTGRSYRNVSLGAQLKANIVRDIIRGFSQNPRMQTVSALAGHLGVSPEALTGDPNVEFPNASRRRSGVNGADEVWRMAVGAAFGDAPASQWRVDPRLLEARFAWPVETLHVVAIKADTMAPRISSGDTVIISKDPAAIDPRTPGVYLIVDGAAEYPVALQPIPGKSPESVEISFENARYSRREIPLDTLSVIGRVLGMIRIESI